MTQTVNKQRPENISLTKQVEHALRHYLSTLNGEDPVDLYHVMLASMERPLFEMIMQHVEGNQSRAADALGLHRNTLRKKLELYALLNQKK